MHFLTLFAVSIFFIYNYAFLFYIFVKHWCIFYFYMHFLFLEIDTFSIFRCIFYFRYNDAFSISKQNDTFWFLRHIDPFSILRHIESDPFSFFRHIILPSGTLQLLDVRQEDAGDYRCSATGGELHKLPDQVDSLPWKRSNAATLRVITGGSSSKNEVKVKRIKALY